MGASNYEIAEAVFLIVAHDSWLMIVKNNQKWMQMQTHLNNANKQVRST